MLQSFRDKLKGYVVYFIVGLIIFIFILGAGSYLFQRTYDNTLAKVNGETISLDIVNQRYQNVIKQHYAKKNYSKIDLNPVKLKQQIFNELLNQVAVIKGLEASGFNVTEEQFLYIVKNNPTLQINGKFSRKKYLNWLKNLGIDEVDYQRFLKQQLLMEQLTNIILNSNFFPIEDVKQFLLKWFQTRKIGYLTVPKTKFAKPIISEEEIKDYYAKHTKELLVPETVKIKYIELSANNLMEKISPTKEQLHKYYQNHLEYYTLPELVRVKHIFVNFSTQNNKNKLEQTNQDPIDLANNKMKEILLKLKAGTSFEELAKKFSEDRNSAAKDGDLGWIGKDEIDPEFDKVAFSLKKAGDISDIIKTKFGYHIIKLTEKREKTINKFENTLDKVTRHFKEEEVQPKLQELYEKLSEASVRNIDLDKVANTLGLPLKISEDFSTRGESSGITSYGEVVAAAFEQKNLHRNSDIIKISEDSFVIFRVIEHKNSREKTFLESNVQIKQILETQKINLQAEQYANNLAAELVKSKNAFNVAKNNNLEWKIASINRNNNTIMPEVVKVAFELPTKQPYKVSTLNNGDFLILQLLNVEDADLEKLSKQQKDIITKMQEQLLQLQSYIEQKLYEKELYNNAKIKFVNKIEQMQN